MLLPHATEQLVMQLRTLRTPFLLALSAALCVSASHAQVDPAAPGVSLVGEARILVPGPGASPAVPGVEQPNTPPQFTKGPDQTVAEDSGPQSVPNWATGILPYSVVRTPIVYASTFDSQPANSTLYGTAAVSGGILHLTDGNQFSALGGFYTPVVPAAIESYNISYTAYVGGGTCCSFGLADGYSINIADDLPVPPPGPGGQAEEGLGNGLSLTFDTFDNGSGEAPAIELEWKGGVVARAEIQVVQQIQRFVPVNIAVSAAGVANVSYDGQLIFSNIALAGYVPTRNLRVGIAGATGGASDNHWIDDLNIMAIALEAASGESAQSVHFVVSNDNPGLFAAQPAVSADGTLTYTPATDACGDANVTVVAQDDGGTANGGRDTSEPQTFSIAVTPVNDCPLAGFGSLRVPNDRPTEILLTYSDPDANGCGSTSIAFTIATPPAKGTLTGTPPNVVFNPNAGAVGADSFSYVVNDGMCDSSPGLVTLDIISSNQPPPNCVAAIVAPSCVITTDETNHTVISLRNGIARIVLAGSGQAAEEGAYIWYTNGVPFASGTLVTNRFALGCHSVTLVVSSGAESCSSTVAFCVMTAEEVVEEFIVLVDDLDLKHKDQRPLLASLDAAAKSFHKEHFRPGINQLMAFQNKVRAQIEPRYPELAAELIAHAQRIIDALTCVLESDSNKDKQQK